MRCIATGFKADEEHHVYGQKSHPEYKNEKWNRIPVSRGIHQEWHLKGTKYMADKYFTIKVWLHNQGWVFCETREKYTHI